MNETFRKFAQKTSIWTGSAWAFVVAVAIVVVWGFTGPLFGFSDTWQLVINTGTTIVTFLMVFLIQNTQNRDARAMQLKLDELLRGVEGARTGMVDLESCSDEELARYQREFERIRQLREVSPKSAEEGAGNLGDEAAVEAGVEGKNPAQAERIGDEVRASARRHAA